MARRLTILAIALLLVGATVAGCGSDNKSSSNTSSSGGGSSSSSKSSGGSTKSSNPQVKQAVASCKQSVASAPKLSASVKSDLDKICVKAGNGDANAVRKAAGEVCVKIVKETAPAGPARTQALSACKQTTKGTSKAAGGVPSY